MVLQELTSALKDELGDEPGGEDIVKRVAEFTEMLLKDLRSKGTKRGFERPNLHPQQPQQHQAHASGYLTPAHSNSNIPTMGSFRKSSQPDEAQLKSKYPSPRLSLASKNIRPSLKEEAEMNSTMMINQMSPALDHDVMGFSFNFNYQGQSMDDLSSFMDPIADNWTNDGAHQSKKSKVEHGSSHLANPSFSLQNSPLTQNTWNQLPNSNQMDGQQFTQLPPRQSCPSNFSFKSSPVEGSPKVADSKYILRDILQHASKSSESPTHIDPRRIIDPNFRPSSKCKQGCKDSTNCQEHTIAHPINITSSSPIGRVLRPAPSSQVTSSATIASTLRQMVEPQHTVKYTTSNPKAQRKRRYKTVYCVQCKKKPDGFRGPHELARHMARQHQSLKPVYIIKDISGYGWLSTCKNCNRRKTYGQDYNAAAHLRRGHFNKPLKTDTEAVKKEKLARKDEPTMEVLRGWMERVIVNAQKLNDNKYLDSADDAIVIESDHEDADEDADAEADYSEDEEGDMTNQEYPDIIDETLQEYQPLFNNPTILEYQSLNSNPPANDSSSNYATFAEPTHQMNYSIPALVPRYDANDPSQNLGVWFGHLEGLKIDPTQVVNWPPPDLTHQNMQSHQFAINNSTAPRTASAVLTESLGDSDMWTDNFTFSDTNEMDFSTNLQF